MKYFTGIGSRNVEDKYNSRIKHISSILTNKGYYLRSGGANGSDSLFEDGVVKNRMEIFLPWNNFNGRSNKYPDNQFISLIDIERHFGNVNEASKIASEIHPVWDKLKDSVRKLHTRNVYQILGLDLKSPSDFVLFYAEESNKGVVKGGTATAVNLARSRGIPTFNMKDIIQIENFWKYYNTSYNHEDF